MQPTQDRADHEAPDPATKTPAAPVRYTVHSKNTPPPKLIIQPTMPAISTVNPKQRKGKNRGALKKPRKVLGALVDVQLRIDKQ